MPSDKECRYTLRLTPEEIAAAREAAARRGVGLAEWTREAIAAAVERSETSLASRLGGAIRAVLGRAGGPVQ